MKKREKYGKYSIRNMPTCILKSTHNFKDTYARIHTHIQTQAQRKIDREREAGMSMRTFVCDRAIERVKVTHNPHPKI